MIHGLRRFVRPELACVFLLACSAGSEEVTHAEISFDAGLSDAIEIVSVERLEPGRKNRLEYLVELRNVSSEAQSVRSALTWLDGSGRQRGGQTFDLRVEPGGTTTLTAPTNDREVSSYRMVLSPIGQPARSDSARDPDAISISVGLMGETGYGTLAVWARGEAAAYDVVIPEDDCGRFRFHPSGECSVSCETPVGQTTSLMVAYEAKDQGLRRGKLRIDFHDPAQGDVDVPLEGRVGADKKGFRKITLY